jgi:hypothetical protein
MPHTFGRIGEYDAHVIGSLSTSPQRIVEHHSPARQSNDLGALQRNCEFAIYTLGPHHNPIMRRTEARVFLVNCATFVPEARTLLALRNSRSDRNLRGVATVMGWLHGLHGSLPSVA